MNNYKRIIYFSIFIFLIILGRVIFLDTDLPASLELLSLYSIDEGFYTQSAFNLYNYGTFTHNVVPYVTGDAGIANLFQTILTYISLLIFGNNYYGVRMPSVFISLITIWLFYLTLRNIKEDNSKFTNYSVFFMVLYFVTDFEYLSISRIYVPTVFRIFFITLMIYIFSRYYKKTYKEIFTYKNIFFFSFLSMSSIFFIYIYNIFIYSATVFTIFIISLINNWKDNKKQIVKDSGLIVLGSLFALLLFVVYLKILYNQTFIDYIYNLIRGDFSGRVILSSRSSGTFNWIYIFLKNMLKAFYSDFSTNIFRFNISLLFIFLLFLPIFIYLIIKKRNILHVFLINIMIFLYLQTIFENSYPYRRLTVLLPVVLVIVFTVFSNENFRIFINFKNKYKLLFYIYSIALIFLSSYIVYDKNIIGKKNGGLKAFKPKLFDGNISLLNVLITLIIFFVILILFYFIKIKNKKLKKVILIFLLIPNFNLISSFTYHNITFDNKNTMLNLSRKINNKILAGQLSFSYRFYNSSRPVLNPYNYYVSKRKEYVNKLSKLLLTKKSKYFLQFYSIKNPLFKIKNEVNSPIKLIVDEVYYVSNGFFIVLYKVEFRKKSKK